MATINDFEDLKCWQEARALCALVFEHFIQNPTLTDKALIDQINRSSGSTMDNIAEGFDRDGNKEFKHFLTIAKASCSEVRSQLHRAYDRGYLSKADYEKLLSSALKTRNLIGGLIKYLRSSDLKGIKFKVEEEEETYATEATCKEKSNIEH